MNEINTDFVLGFLFGISLAACFFFWIVRQLGRREIKAELTVTKEVANQISRGTVEAWLDCRGLTWMPKGIEFNPAEKRGGKK